MSDARHETHGNPETCRADGGAFERWWEERGLGPKILVGVGLGVLGLGMVALFGWIVMLLWNWLMPEIFGLKQLTYWQAWGLLVLCTILFKGIGGRGEHGRADRKRRRHLRRYLRETIVSEDGPAAAPPAPAAP